MTASTAAPEPFDLRGPLPQGTTLLEASAGTGKTYTIAALVARYLAEGVASMDQLLVVSFSRESTRELRERVRERLVAARDALTLLAPGPSYPADDLVRQLRDGVDAAGLAQRRRRLDEAVTSFDAATVTTTHGFCQSMLLALGTVADYDPAAELVEDIGDLVGEVADDLYVRKWGTAGAPPPEVSLADFTDLAMAVATDPATGLLPDAEEGGRAGMRVRAATEVRRQVAHRKRRLAFVDYDDMLVRLRGTLTDQVTGPVARDRLRERFSVVLVDEFQDTDPVQWEILRTAFHGHSTLVLIGDPKQAVYGFRGADVHSYLEARSAAGEVRTLTTNWRSDADLVRALAALTEGAALGDPRIRVRPVLAQHNGRLVQTPAAARLRVLGRVSGHTTQSTLVKAPDARELIAADLADELARLLSSGTTVSPRDGGRPRAVHPGDCAVLVRDNTQARLVQGELQRRGVPTVLAGRTSVFGSPAAVEWQVLLEALEQPHRTARVRRFAAGCFVGLDAAGLDGPAGDEAADELAGRLRGWAAVLERRGVEALFEAVSLAQRLPRRILGQQGGERLLTDLRHLAQVLNRAAVEDSLGVTALVAWLRRRRERADREGGPDRSRRLESDSLSVQVVTVHASKGLEFPVVFVPYAAMLWTGRELSTAVVHRDGRRLRDVGGPRRGGDWERHVEEQKEEDADEELRLTYVALTRAQSHLVLWWAPTTNTRSAPLHRLLFGIPGPDGRTPTDLSVPTEHAALAHLRALAARSGETLAVEPVPDRPAGASYTPPSPADERLRVRVLDREIDVTWQRTSYTRLTAAAHEQSALGSEPEVEQSRDEEDAATAGPTPAVADPLLDVPSLWRGLPSGASFGTAVHSVLESVEDLADASALAETAAVELPWLAGRPEADLLISALAASLATPLGPLADGLTLAGTKPRDRLHELDFELPLTGGDDPTGATATLAGLAALWRAHGPRTGPLRGYDERLDALDAGPLRGYLTGSIDTLLRVGGPAAPRYLVVDYKTNRLAAPDEPLTAWHYRPEALDEAMVEAHYPLQALLYAVAAHRYLRWRQPGYDPQRHLGGVLYLFLRGMTGPDTVDGDGRMPGVFSWRPATELVTGASDLLAGGDR